MANKAQLQLRLKHYRDAFESAPMGFLELDAYPLLRVLQQNTASPDAELSAQACAQRIHVMRANSMAQTLLGGTVLLRGMALAELLPASSQSVVLDCIRRLRTGEMAIEAGICLASAQPFYIKFQLFSSSRLARIGRYFLTFYDISASKVAELELQKSEFKFRTLFEAANISFQQLDVSRQAVLFRQLKASGVTDLTAYIDEHPEFLHSMMEAVHIADVNPYSLKMYGAASKAEVLGPVTRFWIPGNCDTFRKSIEAGYRGEPGYQAETKILKLNGEPIDILFASSSTPALREKGMVILTIVDITPWVRAREQRDSLRHDLAHMSRIATLGELSASIAHEVNQPLAAISTYGEAAIRRLKNDPPEVVRATMLIRNMVNDAHRAADIIVRIRGMARREVPEYQPLALAGLMQDAQLLMAHELRNHSIRLELKIAARLPDISGNKVQLTQVLLNLLLNAIQAIERQAGSQRKIWLQCELCDEMVQIDVKDSGAGIAERDLPHIFDSFYSTKAEGLGLGLQICRSIVESHGGSISAGNHGCGAIFTVRLPL